MQPVLGGIGGVVIEVTDHETNTLYLYITKTEWGKEKKAEADESPFELTAKVDLTSAGQARLKVTDIKPDDKKQK